MIVTSHLFNVRVLEVVNGTLALICLAALVVFGSYIVGRIRSDMEEGGLSLAVAFFTFILGDAIIRGTVWVQYRATNWGYRIAWESLAPFIVLGALISIIGGACVIRVLVPQRRPWHGYLWATLVVVVALGTTVGFVLD